MTRDNRDLSNNCPVRERTGDGVSVGRCYFWLGTDSRCRRHGVIPRTSIDRLPELTEEVQLDEDRMQELVSESERLGLYTLYRSESGK